jgi:hypothetical protein
VVYVAIAEAAALVSVVAVLLRAMARMQRQHARREDLLLNQLLHLTGHTWQPSPADEARRGDVHAREPRPITWTASPEQLPVD